MSMKIGGLLSAISEPYQGSCSGTYIYAQSEIVTPSLSLFERKT